MKVNIMNYDEKVALVKVENWLSNTIVTKNAIRNIIAVNTTCFQNLFPLFTCTNHSLKENAFVMQKYINKHK